MCKVCRGRLVCKVDADDDAVRIGIDLTPTNKIFGPFQEPSQTQSHTATNAARKLSEGSRGT